MRWQFREQEDQIEDCLASVIIVGGHVEILEQIIRQCKSFQEAVPIACQTIPLLSLDKLSIENLPSLKSAGEKLTVVTLDLSINDVGRKIMGRYLHDRSILRISPSAPASVHSIASEFRA